MSLSGEELPSRYTGFKPESASHASVSSESAERRTRARFTGGAMSGKRTAAVQAAPSATARPALSRHSVNRSEASARWAALDSRHERLVTASDAVLADVDRSGDRRMAS